MKYEFGLWSSSVSTGAMCEHDSALICFIHFSGTESTLSLFLRFWYIFRLQFHIDPSLELQTFTASIELVDFDIIRPQVFFNILRWPTVHWTIKDICLIQISDWKTAEEQNSDVYGDGLGDSHATPLRTLPISLWYTLGNLSMKFKLLFRHKTKRKKDRSRTETMLEPLFENYCQESHNKSSVVRVE